MWTWGQTKDKTGKALRWLFVESAKSALTYYATRKGVEKGAKKVGDEVRKAGQDVMINFTKKF